MAAGKCAACDNACTPDNAESFDFDHLDPLSKEFDISTMREAPDGKFFGELSKCQLLCCDPCHKARTKEQRDVMALKRSEAKKRKGATECNDATPSPGDS